MKKENGGAGQAKDQEKEKRGFGTQRVKRHGLHFVLNPPLSVCQRSVAFLHQSKSWTAVGKPEVRAGAAGATWRLRTQESTDVS